MAAAAPKPDPSAHPPTNSTLLAAGFNALSQLQPNNGEQDIFSFTPILAQSHTSAQDVRLFFAGWSSTAFIADNHLIILGHGATIQPLEPTVARTLHCGFGDHNGLAGCLSSDGNLYTTSASPGSEPGSLQQLGDNDSPRLGLLALAGNGKVAITFKQAPNGNLAHLLQFPSLDDFKTWHASPSTYQIDAEKQHFMLPGRPRQLLAGTGTFTLLMSGGEVYTWGDARFRSLGRDTLDAPAERPALVEALGGLKIVKVAAGGWLGAAVSEDKAAYVWGTGRIGAERVMRPLRVEGEVKLVEVGPEGGLDVVDVGVGTAHLVVLVEGGGVFVVGENRNGQLGLGEEAEEFVEEWREVEEVTDVHSVVCGPQASFVYQTPPRGP